MLAIVIFAVAAAIAVVQATNSDDPAGADQAQTVSAASTTDDVQSSASSESDDEPVEQPSALTQEDVSSETEDAESEEAADTVAESEQENQPDQSQATEEQAQQQASADTPTEQETDDPVRGFIVPISGACITEFTGHLPSAERAYRNNGVHEGLDFYEWASCTAVNVATEILAAKSGVVIRADLNYVEITPADWERFERANFAGEAILDELRGRQVWIDHGHGVVTRYAHLSAIAPDISVGVEVQRGQVIGYPGESGQREVYADPGTDIHLHFEIRVADGWLGQGDAPEVARLRYLRAFGLVP